MMAIRRWVVLIWLVALIVLSILRVRDWRTDRALWEAAARVSPVTDRTYGRLQRWGDILLREETPPLRQPFSTRRRPRVVRFDTVPPERPR